MRSLVWKKITRHVGKIGRAVETFENDVTLAVWGFCLHLMLLGTALWTSVPDHPGQKSGARRLADIDLVLSHHEIRAH